MQTTRTELIDDKEVRTTLRIPSYLINELKHLAIDKETTVTALFIEALKLYLKTNKK